MYVPRMTVSHPRLPVLGFRAAGLGNWQVTRHDRLLSGSFFIHSGSGFFFIKMFIHAVKEYGIIGPMRGEVVGT
jgi:hypothetical protein